MPGNRRLPRNGSATDRVEEAMRHLKVDGSDDKGRVRDDQGAYPDRPGEPDCIYFLRTGSCGYGSNCRFNHPSNGGQVYGVKNTGDLPERAGQPDCGYYLKTGTCKYGSTCKYHHPKDKQADVLMNVLGLPIRQDTKPCPYYMRTGSCKYGFACKFHHPHPTSAANVLPIVGPVYGSGGNAVVPSSNATSVGELPAGQLSKATYFASSVIQVPQNYMPLFLTPSQGWNAYMGGVSPLPVTGVVTAPASNGQMSVSHLPERPDQPECRYFMTHGTCKYGGDCKYHHPRDKASQLVSSSIGPLGLPLRPGQPICSYYSFYGLCKYGPTCKYDHPMDGFSYPYSLTMPPLATAAYTPSPPYQRVGPFLPETPLSKPATLSDWIKNGETTSDKNPNSSTKSVVVDSPPLSDSLPNSSKASSEIIHHESD